MVGIALGRHAGSGKDTIGAILVEEIIQRGHKAAVMKLADPIFAEAVTKYGMSPVRKDRALMQCIGDMHTDKNPLHYVDLLWERVVQFNGTPVVTDLRKKVEANALARRGFFLVELVVPEEIRIARLRSRDTNFDPETLNHWTERDLDGYEGWHYRIDNYNLFAERVADAILAQHLSYVKRTSTESNKFLVT